MLKSKPEDDSRYYFILLSIPLSFGLLMNALKCGKEFFVQPGPLIPFFIGVIIWILFWHKYLRNIPYNKLLDFLGTDHHEHQHLTADIIWFFGNTDIDELHVSSKPYLMGNKSYLKGHILSTPPKNLFGLAFVYLAPFFLTVLLMPLLSIRMMIADTFLPLFDIIIGITFCFYIINNTVSAKRDIKVELANPDEESDIGKLGVPFALAYIILLNLIVMPAIVLIIHQGWLSAARHCISGFTFWIDLMI